LPVEPETRITNSSFESLKESMGFAVHLGQTH